MGDRPSEEALRPRALIMFCTQISDRQVFLDGAKSKEATVSLVAYHILQPEERDGKVWMVAALALSYRFEWDQDGMSCRWSFEERHKGDEKGKVSLRSSLWAMLEDANVPLHVTDKTGVLG